jgi:transposase InsO family protein
MDKVAENYVNPGHPTAFAGKQVLYNYYKGRFTKKQINDFLHGTDTYTVKREAKRVNSYNPYYVYEKRKLVQADLIDWTVDQDLVQANANTRYLFCVIDSFSRYLWVEPMKTKSAKECTATFIKILQAMGTKPQRFLSDRGSEFTSNMFRGLLRVNNITQIFANHHAGTVERVQRSLQSLIYRYIEENQSRTFLPVLQDLVKTYNTRKHRTIKMSPEGAEDDANLVALRENVVAYYEKAVAKGNKNTKFKIGDTVRILRDRGRFGRGYDDIFTREVFKIDVINNNMPIPLYNITNYDGTEHIKGTFYARELQIISKQVFKVSKVLKRRTRNKVKEAYVSWLGYGAEHNSWIPATDILRSYNATN